MDQEATEKHQAQDEFKSRQGEGCDLHQRAGHEGIPCQYLLKSRDVEQLDHAGPGEEQAEAISGQEIEWF